MRTTSLLALVLAAASLPLLGPVPALAGSASVAVGPQFDTTHVYVPVADYDRFVASLIATFSGTTTTQVTATVTPTPSSTLSQLAVTPAGLVSAFGFKTPVPYPFGAERTGYLVKDMDEAVAAARDAGAEVIVSTFPDPIGRDAVIQWPGGVYMQLYWHTTPPSYPALKTVPENRVYVSPDRADTFVKDFVAFLKGKVVSDERQAPGEELGMPGTGHWRIRIESGFGKMAVFVTDGHLPFPFGRETTGYEVDNLSETLAKAQKAGVAIVVQPVTVGGGSIRRRRGVPRGLPRRDPRSIAVSDPRASLLFTRLPGSVRCCSGWPAREHGREMRPHRLGRTPRRRKMPPCRP